MRTLEKLTIRNFKSIRDQTLELGPLNVFIGGNGAGKSNLIETFRFLREIINQNLALYTATKGGADALLHFGRRKSSGMELHLQFGEGNTSHGYSAYLRGVDDDRLILLIEAVNHHDKTQPGEASSLTIAEIADESRLRDTSHAVARQLLHDLDSYRVYHFHDTSDTAAVKATVDVDDNRFLRPQAENLAAFLYWMQEKQPDHMANIQDTVRQIAPFFDSFVLAPSKLNPSKIRTRIFSTREMHIGRVRQ